MQLLPHVDGPPSRGPYDILRRLASLLVLSKSSPLRRASIWCGARETSIPPFTQGRLWLYRETEQVEENYADQHTERLVQEVDRERVTPDQVEHGDLYREGAL